MITYKANTDQGISENFQTNKGDIYAVYISTKWAVKNGYELNEVLRIKEKDNNQCAVNVIFDKDN